MYTELPKGSETFRFMQVFVDCLLICKKCIAVHDLLANNLFIVAADFPEIADLPVQHISGLRLKLNLTISGKKKELHDLSPRANNTDRATDACRRS
jgi:hypothetical protein